MIRGIGTDIVEVERIASLIDRYGDHFVKKVFTAWECSYCSCFLHSELHFAGRWAVKEAFYKALPVNVQQYSFWRSIETISSNGQKPFIRICSKELERFLANDSIYNFHVSISHEQKFATATVILE